MLKVGDEVLAREPQTGKTSARKVVRTYQRQAPATVVLRLKNGERIECTPEHPLYVQGKGFVRAGQLGIGSSIVTRAGPGVAVASVQRRARAVAVYNCEVAGYHTYFVGRSELWSHNTCGSDIPTEPELVTTPPEPPPVEGPPGAEAAQVETPPGDQHIRPFNPFKGKGPDEIDTMFRDKGFEPRGPDPVKGKGGYVNPQSNRSYHIDPQNSYGEAPHVDVNRPRGYNGPLARIMHE